MPLYVGDDAVIGDSLVLDGPAVPTVGGAGGFLYLYRSRGASTTTPPDGGITSDSLIYPLGIVLQAVYPAGASLSTATGVVLEQSIVFGWSSDPSVVYGITNVG